MAKRPTRRPAPTAPARDVVEAAPIAPGDKLTPDQADAIADELEELFEPAPTLLELTGTPSFLDLLDGMPQQVRDARGYRFKVYALDRGPQAYLPDSDWGGTPPTEGAIAERYGPGSYKVTVQARRKGQGGGALPDIRITIARPRDPGAAPSAPAHGDDRAWGLVDRLLDDKGQVATDRSASIPDEPPPWLVELLKGQTKADELPEWLQPILGKFLAGMIPDNAAGAAAAAAGATS